MKAADLGGLVVAAVLLAKTGLFKDLIPPPGTPPVTPTDNDGLGLRDISFAAWQEMNPGGSRLEYEDFLRGV